MINKIRIERSMLTSPLYFYELHPKHLDAIAPIKVASRVRAFGQSLKQSENNTMKLRIVSNILVSLLRDGGSLAYAIIAALGAPYFLRYKRRLLQKGRSDIEFDWARWTINFGSEQNDAPSEAVMVGPRVAFVLASWGEVTTMEPLIWALRCERPNVGVLISVERREAITAARALSDEAVSPFPFDSPLPVARWHARVRPDLVVFFEQFDFPTLTRSLWIQRVPFIVIQARVNSSHGLGYQRHLAHPKFKRWQLRGLNTMLVSSQEQSNLIAPILANEARIRVVGSIKFPTERARLASARAAELRAWIDTATAGAPLLVAGSTHATEEAFLLDALEIVLANYNGQTPVLLLAPRRLHRAEAVAELLNERGIDFLRRSQSATKQPISGNPKVLLLDTLGELGVAYSCGVAAFVGGTINGASHNVAEPLAWGVPVAYGPIRGNFGVEQTLCENAGVGFRIQTPDELAEHWISLLESSELRAEMGSKARHLLEAQSGAFTRTLQTLLEAVDAVSPSSPSLSR